MEEVRYFMEETIATVDSDASVKEAAEIMRDNSISSLLVKHGGNYSGILTDTDLTRKLVARNLDPSQTSVSAIASKSLISIESDSTMAEAYDCMKQKNIRHLAITKNEKINGVLSIKDFANYYHNKHSGTGEDNGDIEYFMQSSVLNIESYETVLTAAEKMANRKVGALLVTEQGKGKGILSESTITMDIVAAGLDFANTKISSVLTRQIKTIDCSQTMSSAYQKMRENNVRHLFVTRGKKIAGMLSIRDFANYYNFKFCKQIDEEDRVRHYMQENLETIPETMSVQKAAEIMKEKEIGSLLVKDLEEVTGIVTEVDFTRAVLGSHLNPERTPVSKVMRSPLKLDETKPMDEALTMMHDNDTKYVAITNESKVVGIISLKDITIYYKHKYILANDMDE
ncbi:MAG: CBS domain-containing protein [Nitrospinota bacterium]